MKFGAKPRETWKSSTDLNGKYNRLNSQLNRLMILDHVWDQLVADKKCYWKLAGVKGSCLYVCVKVAVAKNELVARRETFIKELNKHFDRPWIKKIEIVKDLGVINE